MRKYNFKDWVDKPIAQVTEEAEAEGFEVYLSGRYVLLLDLDDDDAINRYTEMLPMARRLFGAIEEDQWDSKSGNGVHVVLRLPEPLDAATRTAIQACLGSDPRREMLGLMRLRNGEKEPGLLFRPRKEKKRGRKN